jgi:hypothetical protein
MKAWKRTLTLLMILALTAFGAGVAQDDQQQDQDQQQSQEEQAQPETQTRTIEIEGEEVAPLGEIQVGEAEPYEAETTTVQVEVETGAIIFNATTPGGERPNIDLVGPNGYYDHFEVRADEDGRHVVEGLLPGVYSVAATDDGLQVAHTLVEVTAGQAIAVNIALEELAAYEEGTFQPDERTAFPDNGFETAEPQAIENAEFGEVTVETENDNARFVITGPNNYSQEFTGTFTASDLTPGVYVIAGTLEDSYVLEGTLAGAEIATSAVAVNVSQAVRMVPVYDIAGAEAEEIEAETEDVEDVAGGGAGEEGEETEVEGEVTDVETDVDVETEEETDAETDAETDEAEQPATEETDTEQPDTEDTDTDETERDGNN